MIPIEIESEDESIHTNLRALPNSSIFSDLISKTLGRLMSSANSLKIKSTTSGASILAVPIITLGGDKLRIRDNVYKLTPKIYKSLSYTGYTGNTMKKASDILMMNNNIKDLGYISLVIKNQTEKHF